jgi:hypothetical protein
MGYDAKTQRLISLKKLAGKAQTSNDKDLANEGLPSGVTMTSETVFGETISTSPSSTSLYTITGKVEYIRFTSTFIAGADTSDGRHGFELKLPSDYESNSSNPKKGIYPFVNSQTINITSGALQIVPTSFANAYEAKPYYNGSAAKGSGTQIPILDARDWYLDYFNGVFFQQDPPGTGDHSENPDYVEAYLYIGDMLDTVVATSSTGSLSRKKDVFWVTSSVSAGSPYNVYEPDFESVSYDPNSIDIFLNGQLLHSGSSYEVATAARDYYISPPHSLKLCFDTQVDDVLDIVVYTVS